MRTKLFTTIVFIISLLSAESSKGKGCDYIIITFGNMQPIGFSEGGIVSQTYIINIDSAYDLNSIIADTLSVYEDGWICGWYLNHTYVNDTGYSQISIMTMEGDHVIIHLNITRNSIISSVQNVNSSIAVSIFPAISTGIFKINSSDKLLKRILISDISGNCIISGTNNFSEIDLTNFSPGIYFYAITDEKENVFRGRIVKE